jgi:site-specific DNA recombinase
VVGAIPAIVTREQFDLVRAKLATNRTFARRNNTAANYLLRALLSCGHCGLACQARRVLPDSRYYICTEKYLQVRQRTGTTCTARFVPAAQVDDLVWQDLCDLVQHPDVVAQALRRAAGGHWLPQEWQARRDGLRRGRASLAQQLERLTEAYLGDAWGTSSRCPSTSAAGPTWSGGRKPWRARRSSWAGRQTD